MSNDDFDIEDINGKEELKFKDKLRSKRPLRRTGLIEAMYRLYTLWDTCFRSVSRYLCW
jgi:hypothetical protein